jgi:2-methylcitrate dehydratase PrpD
MGRSHLEQGWHTGATLGVFSSAAAAANLLGLDEERTLHTIGIAGTQAAGLMAAQFGSMVKRMHSGKAAESGLYASLLAEKGFTGIMDIFEAEYGGFCTTFSGGSENFDRDQLTSHLGDRFETMRVSLKFYSCVASNHTTLDAIRNLQVERPFESDEIDQIIVHASKATLEHVGWKYRPEGVTASQLNLGFCVATYLLEGACFVEQFSESVVADPARIALAERLQCREDPSITAEGPDMRHKVHVEVYLKDGTTLRKTVEKAQGSEEHWAPDELIETKFKRLAGQVLSDNQALQLKEMVLSLDDLADASELARLLVPWS